MIEYRNATIDDIDQVLKNLWLRGEREMSRVGITSHSELENYVKNHPHATLFTFYENDEILAIAGSDVYEGTHYTLFFATEDFTSKGLALTRFMKRFTRERVRALNVEKLELWSASDHHSVEKWYNTIGFYKVGNYEPNSKAVKDGTPYVRYLYQSENTLA